jgi:hypothetical protein
MTNMASGNPKRQALTTAVDPQFRSQRPYPTEYLEITKVLAACYQIAVMTQAIEHKGGQQYTHPPTRDNHVVVQ